MSAPKSWRNVEIEQQTRFGFTEDKIIQILSTWENIDKYAWIKHDKDTKEDGTPKEEHIHLMIRFKYPEMTTNILSKFKDIIKENNLERIKSWNGALAYLCHWNDDTKYRYEISDVHANFDWTEPAKKGLSRTDRINEIVKQIAEGQIKEYNITDNISPEEYTQHKPKIDRAFEYRRKQLLRENEKNMDVIYIYGDSETGKTTYAKQIATERGMTYYISDAGKDFMQSYAGQECIILDDFRGSDISVSEFLKLCDNHTASAVHSRYYNKYINECKLMIITTIQPPEDFFSDIENEPMTQIKRRCQCLFHMTKENINIYMYDNTIQDYKPLGFVPNLISEKFNKPMTNEEKLEYLASVLGGTSEIMTELKKTIESNKEEIISTWQAIQ